MTGTLAGKEVTGFGGFDRTYGTRKQFDQMMDEPWVLCHFAGRREDGTREWGMFVIGARPGSSFACYTRDGSAPVLSTDLDYEWDWEELGYSDPGTTVLKWARVSFGGKTINYTAQWGFRGHRDEYLGPTSKEPGMTHGSGTWYEGATPYEHTSSTVYNESHRIFNGQL